jgi:hypothetical protein
MAAGLEWNEYVPFTDPKNSEMRMISLGAWAGIALVVREFLG